MQRRGGFYGVALALVCGGACSAPPVPTSAAPALAAPLPTPTPSVAAAPVASALPVPPPKLVWSTPSRSNVCTGYARAPVSGPSFDTREACEKWVQERSCQPGFTCFDGCNWRTCTSGGETTISTLVECSVALAVELKFQANTAKLSAEPDWAVIVAGIERALRPHERSITVLGYVEPNEARGHAGAQRRLGLQRAQVVVKELGERGIATHRLVAKLGDASAFGPRRTDAVLRRVRLEPVPAWRVRDDFEPSSREYQEFCGAKPHRGE
jgi:outer membrane protein OmpA-like peptidoglycan-associated protein